ncbi:hypothetical protein I4U23_027268 [Adineta vaga]|nr:hypothetical protein I4U23_027268 [Adineta vaga]
MALPVWQKGRPTHTWAVYEKATCTSCRTYFEASGDIETLGNTSDHWFDWIYNQNIVYLPTPSEPASQHSNYEPQFEQFTNSQRQNSFETLKRCLIETGFTGRIQKTFSFATITEHSRYNIRNQTFKIIQHTMQILLQDDADEVWNDIMDNYQPSSYKDQK